jgi:dTDP-4-dehydrorhamnose reductase
MIVGCLGMLGSDLMQAFGADYEIMGLDRPELDITDPRQCFQYAESFQPEVIINAAALTNVDGCETRPQEAMKVNGYGAGNLAVAAASIGAQIVHFSTDYVFDGRKTEAYLETDPAAPLNSYGKSKWLGEELVRSCNPDHLIIRTSWLFGRNGKNFIRTILALSKEQQEIRIVNDQRGSPTFTHDLAAQTMRLTAAGCRETYHVTNSGSCTWFELASTALACAGIEEVRVIPVSTAEFPRLARRPANSVLANARLEREGFPFLRPWPIAVREYIDCC